MKEGPVSDTGDAITNRDAAQTGAEEKGTLPDAGDAVWNDVIGTCLASRISKQQRLLFIKQNPIDIRVIHVSRANLNRRQAGAFVEGSPDAGNAVRDRDARQAAAALEGPIPDAGNAIRNRDARQAGAVFESPLPDAGDAVRNRDARQASAATEGGILDAGNAIRNRDARQAGAANEGSSPDAGYTIRDCDARQVSAVVEGQNPDAGDAVRNDIIGTCLASRISMQNRLSSIKQDPFDIRVIHVTRANLNSRQAGAVREGSSPDAGDAVRDRDARQAGAVVEGSSPDAGDAIRNRDPC